MKWWRFLAVCLFLLPLVVGAETITIVPSPTWKDGTAVSAADAAKFTFYFRIWRGTDPKAVPLTSYYFGELRNGATTWTDNVMVRANAYILPPLVPGDNVIVSVSAAFLGSDGVERDSWMTDQPGLAQAWRIPGWVAPPPPPPPKPQPGCNPPVSMTIK